MILIPLMILLLINIMNRDKLKAQLKIHEGYREKVYLDTTGNRTIGIGFNLERYDAPILVRSVGANYAQLIAGEQTLNSTQIEMLLDRTLDEAVGTAKQLVKNFDELDDVRQRVIVDMSFNMGPKVFRQFIKTRKAIANEEFDVAAERMLRSKWAGQVKGRAKNLAYMMKTGKDVYDL